MAKSIGSGWGDAFLVNTPTLDQLSNRMYQEQKMQEAKRQQEDMMLDNQLKQELGKVRSVDTPDVLNAYQEYKGLKKRALFDKKIQRDPLAYNQLQQDMNKAYSNIFSVAKGSEEMKDFQKQQAAERAKNPMAFDDNAGTMLATAINTPLSQLRDHPQFGDLTNPDTYTYKGSNTDFGKIVRDNAGQPKQVYTESKVLDGGLQTQLTPYLYGNTPGQIKDSVLGAMALHQTGRDAAYQWDHTPEKVIEDTIKAYQALPAEYWTKMGLPGPQDLLPKNPDNKAENYASLLAMQHAIANQPKEGTPIFRENKAAVMAAQEARDKRMQAIKQADAEKIVRLKASLDPNDTEMNNTWVERFWETRINKAKESEENLHTIYNSADPKLNKQGYLIEPNGVMMKALSRDGREPDRVYVTKDNKIWPIFYKYGPPTDKDGDVIKGREKEVVKQTNKAGHPLLDEDYSRPMDLDQAYLDLGYKGQTKKELGSTMSGTTIPQAAAQKSGDWRSRATKMK